MLWLILLAFPSGGGLALALLLPRPQRGLDPYIARRIAGRIPPPWLYRTDHPLYMPPGHPERRNLELYYYGRSPR